MNKCIQCKEFGKECKRCYDRRRYITNKKSILERNRAWKLLYGDKDKERKCQEKWRKNNKEWIRNWHKKNQKRINKYCRNRLRNMPQLRVSANISRNIYHSLKKLKNGNHWENLVGYSLDILIHHIEKKFKTGMSWQNYGRGGWHIDHVIPKSHFNIIDEKCDDFKNCWSLKNLQPLWECENCSKGNKFIG